MLHVDMGFFPNIMLGMSTWDFFPNIMFRKKSHVDFDMQKFHVNMQFFSEHEIFFSTCVFGKNKRKKITCSEKNRMLTWNCSYLT